MDLRKSARLNPGSEFTQSETLIGLEYSGLQSNQIVAFNKNKLTLKTYQKLVKQKTLIKMNCENEMYQKRAFENDKL